MNPETVHRSSSPQSGGDPVLELVAAFQSGDRDRSFRALFDRYYQPLRRFFTRKGMKPEDCLDLTQETFLGIYRGLDAYRPNARFEAWLYTIAQTTYLKRIRASSAQKRSGEEVPHEEAGPSILPSPGTQLEDILEDERHTALQQAIAELPEKMARCLTLRLAQGLKYREIASLLRLSPETVKVHLFQARKRLRKTLHELAPEDP